MSWLRTVLFGDVRCTRCRRTRAACVCGRNPSRAVSGRQPRVRKRESTDVGFSVQNTARKRK